MEPTTANVRLRVALDRVKVDLGKVFEKGQAYVALSRATSLEGLQVLHFNADKVCSLTSSPSACFGIVLPK